MENVKLIMNPPIYASLIAIPLALIPYIKEYVLVENGSVMGKNVYKALVIIGSCASPVIDLVLGINLSRGIADSATIKKIHLGLILIGKLLIMPSIGYGLITVLYNVGIMVKFRQNRILSVMMLIIFSGPTSLQLLMICIVHEHNVENISKVYFVMYLIAVVPLTLWTMVFLTTLY